MRAFSAASPRAAATPARRSASKGGLQDRRGWRDQADHYSGLGYAASKGGSQGARHTRAARALLGWRGQGPAHPAALPARPARTPLPGPGSSWRSASGRRSNRPGSGLRAAAGRRGGQAVGGRWLAPATPRKGCLLGSRERPARRQTAAWLPHCLLGPTRRAHTGGQRAPWRPGEAGLVSRASSEQATTVSTLSPPSRKASSSSSSYSLAGWLVPSPPMGCRHGARGGGGVGRTAAAAGPRARRARRRQALAPGARGPHAYAGSGGEHGLHAAALLQRPLAGQQVKGTGRRLQGNKAVNLRRQTQAAGWGSWAVGGRGHHAQPPHGPRAGCAGSPRAQQGRGTRRGCPSRPSPLGASWCRCRKKQTARRTWAGLHG